MFPRNQVGCFFLFVMVDCTGKKRQNSEAMWASVNSCVKVAEIKTINIPLLKLLHATTLNIDFKHTFTLKTPKHVMCTVTHQGTGVGGICGVVFEKSRQSKIGHFTHQIAVDQNVAGS